MKHKLADEETILGDDYSVFWDYVYIADNKFIRSNTQGTVKDLKRDLGAKEIRRCDLSSHVNARFGEEVH